MKTVVLLLGMVSVALAATTTTTTPTHGHSVHTTPHLAGGDLDRLIRQQVMILLTQHPDLNLENCSTKCDALFDLVSHQHEVMTDELCHFECRRVINYHNHHAHTTTPGS